MRGEQTIFNLEIKKKSGLSLNPDIHHSKVFSSDHPSLGLTTKLKLNIILQFLPNTLQIQTLDRQ